MNTDSRGEVYFWNRWLSESPSARVRHYAQCAHALVPARGANNGAKSCIVAVRIVSRKAVTSSSRSCALSFPPYPDSIPLPLQRVRLLSPLIRSDVPASGIEGENSNPARSLSLSFPSSSPPLSLFFATSPKANTRGNLIYQI